VKRLFFFLAVMLLPTSACNLGTAQDAREDNLNATQTAIPVATLAILEPVEATSAPLPTNPVVLTPLSTSAVQLTPLLSSNNSVSCEGRLRVDVGADPGNTLRLRSQPNNSSTILLLIPNSSYVNRVAGSQEVSADGYTWVNIRYIDPNGIEVLGWGARDAMRDRATLREEGC